MSENYDPGPSREDPKPYGKVPRSYPGSNEVGRIIHAPFCWH